MYVIKITREFYGPKTERALVLNRPGSRALRFESANAARAYVSKVESDAYHLSHNESGGPAYKILRADSLPQYLANQLLSETP